MTEVKSLFLKKIKDFEIKSKSALVIIERDFWNAVSRYSMKNAWNKEDEIWVRFNKVMNVILQF